MNDRKIKSCINEDIDCEELFTGTPTEIIERIKELQDKYKDKTIYFKAYENEEDDNYYQFNLWENRLETDKEYETRLEQEARYEQARNKLKKDTEDRERKEYERLKKKFG